MATRLPVTYELLRDLRAIPRPYMTHAFVVIWPIEPIDPLIHSLRWIYER